MSGINRQFAPPAETRKVSSAKDEHRAEEARLNRRAPPKVKKEKTSYYERQLEKYGFK